MEERKQTRLNLIISFIIFILVISIFVVGYSIWQKNNSEEIEQDPDAFIDWRGPRIQGYYSISEAIDEFEKETDSLILGYLFGGDTQLAKEKMGDGRYGKLFSDTKSVRWERFYDYKTHTASNHSEQFEMYDTERGIEVYLSIRKVADKFSHNAEYEKHTADDGREYFVYNRGGDVGYTIELGGNVTYTFYDTKADETGREDMINSLLEYGFMLKDSAPNPTESTIRAYHP